MPESPPLLLAGPTSVGKSAVALLCADRINGEIISVDAMQVYRGMDVGTAKPMAAERAKVRHHLIDIVDLQNSFDASQFVQHAQSAVKDIQSRGRVPILCGGTGLYFQAYLEGLGEAPPSDREMRWHLEQTPLPDLLDELQKGDPASFQTMDVKNRRRVVRAVEVLRLTGRPFSSQRAGWRTKDGAAPSVQDETRMWPFFGLERSKEDLHRRINERVDQMFALGLIEETRALLAHGLAENRTALQALGYHQVVEHLQGLRSLEETVTLVKQKTRNYAKRQMTWFRRHSYLEWIKVGEGEASERVAERLSIRYAARVQAALAAQRRSSF